jgi:BirA family biotin operon repressor/biotin-[acetyl-CoA-carboxylase] ligase
VWLLADRQSAGRGRRGRSWASEPGNLFLTYLGQTHNELSRVAQLGFAAAVAVAETADALGVAPAAQVKWPNDVLIAGAKVCGILPESGALGPGQTWFALGIGVNIASNPEGGPYPVTCLSGALGKPVAVDAVFELLRLRLAHWAQALSLDGFGALRAAWLTRAYGLGAAAEAKLGETIVRGQFEALDADGALRLRLADGEVRTISAGEVFFPRP